MLNDILPSQTKGKDVFKTTIKPAILKQVCNINNSSFYDKKNEISRLEKLIENSYIRYLENSFRRAFDFKGTPIKIQFKNKNSIINVISLSARDDYKIN